MSKPIEFESMPDAFDYCREADRPVAVIVAGERWKLFPSGRAERLRESVADAIRSTMEAAIHGENP